MKSTRSLPAAFRIAAVQMRCADTIEENLKLIEQAVRSAARRKADAILLPECATTGYRCDFRRLDREALHDTLARVGQLAADCAVNILIGTPMFDGRALHNCLLVFDRTGRAVYRYAKCQLAPQDGDVFTPGNWMALFEIDGIPATAIICHERRYPELVRLPVMAGARLIFHPNAGLDTLAVSRKKRNGRDGIVARAFENAVPYVFANTVGHQGGGRWSAGDSKIVAADGTIVQLADNKGPAVIVADLDMTQATGKYAEQIQRVPKFLASDWRRMVRKVKDRAKRGQL